MSNIKKQNEKVKEIRWALEIIGLSKKEIDLMLKVVKPKKNYGI